MKWNQYLSFACKDHVLSQGPLGETGHTSPNKDTMTMRLDKYGKW